MADVVISLEFSTNVKGGQNTLANVAILALGYKLLNKIVALQQERSEIVKTQRHYVAVYSHVYKACNTRE